MIVNLQKVGIIVSVEDDWMAMFTPTFHATGREEVELMIAGKAQHVRLVGTTGDRVVVSHDPIYVHAKMLTR